MSDDVRPYLHTASGKVTELTVDAASAFPDYLIEVEPGTKDYEPGLFKPGTVEEFRARRAEGAKYESAEKIAADEETTDKKKAEK